MENTDLDQDLEKLSHEELLAEAKRLRAAVREHGQSRNSAEAQASEAARTNAPFQADVKPVDLYNT